jgi:His Kinase A (phospho-acceptor) domain
MLGRLEAEFAREAAFVSNASHELRTPLSVIRAEADVTLADEADDPEALRRSLAVVREASERSERLIEALLALARAERDEHPWSEVDLSQLVRQLTEETDLDGLRLELALRPARAPGDQELLRTMTANLIDNAVRHNVANGWIEIRTESAGKEAQLEISNSGPMIAAGEAASLTNRSVAWDGHGPATASASVCRSPPRWRRRMEGGLRSPRSSEADCGSRSGCRQNSRAEAVRVAASTPLAPPVAAATTPRAAEPATVIDGQPHLTRR